MSELLLGEVSRLTGHRKVTGNDPAASGPYAGLAYLDAKTRVQSIHPVVKLVLLLSYSLTALSLPAVGGQTVLSALLLVFIGLSGLGFGFWLGKSKFILLFGLLIFVAQAAGSPHGVLWWQLRVGPLALSLWSQGVQSGLVAMLRFINVIGGSYLFVATTDPNRLAYALMQVGLPYRFGFALITALRFVPVVQQQLQQIKNAQLAKGIELEGLAPRNILRSVRYVFAPLVISSLSQVDALAMSMEGRAFGLYSKRSYLHPEPLTRRDRWLMAFIVLFFSGLQLLWRRHV